MLSRWPPGWYSRRSSDWKALGTRSEDVAHSKSAHTHTHKLNGSAHKNAAPHKRIRKGEVVKCSAH